MSKTLAAAAPGAVLTFSSAGGIITGSGRPVDVSGTSVHTLDADVFNRRRNTLLDRAPGDVCASAGREFPADQLPDRRSSP